MVEYKIIENLLKNARDRTHIRLARPKDLGQQRKNWLIEPAGCGCEEVLPPVMPSPEILGLAKREVHAENRERSRMLADSEGFVPVKRNWSELTQIFYALGVLDSLTQQKSRRFWVPGPERRQRNSSIE